MSERAYETGTAGWAGARERVAIRYTPADILTLLWRRIPLMLLVFVVILAVGAVVALRMKSTYPAHSSLLVRLGQEYVYQPRVGDAARGAVPTNDEVVQSELEILQSRAVKERVVLDIGLARMSPALGRAYATADEARRRELVAAAVKSIDTGLKVQTAPDNAIVKLTFSAADPELAALVLNTLVDEYLRYRRTVLIDGEAGAVQGQLKAFQDQLTAADQDYQKFLADNQIGSGDFEAEKTYLTQQYSQLSTESLTAQAALAEAEGRLSVVAREAAGAQPEIGLYRDLDHTAQDELNRLINQRQDLLSRYLPSAGPVREMDQKIAAQQALASRGPLDGGARRMGPNPIYQSLITEKNQLQAQAAALRLRKGELTALLAGIAERRQKLAALEPRYQALARQRDLLGANVKTLAQRAQESQAAEAPGKAGDDNIRVIERAYPTPKGTSLKGPVLLISVLFGAFAALCAGLFSAFTASGYPTPEAVERTLNLPVLAAAPARAV
jgi:uncharacterized protein involved in exopolysaccharide biosynthesis